MIGLSTLARKLFGGSNERKVKAVRLLVDRINVLEPAFQKLSDEELRAMTPAFRQRISEKGISLDDLLPEAFAVVREVARRRLGLRHFDVQLTGGIMLHQGRIAEMRTGEGKTLVATLPVYLNALLGKGVHVVTVNDYLARRDATWMSQVYSALGMSVGVIVHGLDDVERRAAYNADITYGTNNEFGFDYLRDNMKYSREQMVQRGHFFAIVDEVDSILIDEARTPLIISGPTEDRSALYSTINALVPQLTTEHFEVDEKQRTATLTEEGIEAVEATLRTANLVKEGTTLYDPENVTLVHHINQALKAHKLFSCDKDYIVREGQVVIIDEFTGRMMPGRRYSDGLHQALEAKEAQPIQPENVTLASVTFQNYFRLYKKLAGMTGTAMTEVEEFMEIYGLDVVDIPTNKPVCRLDEDDQVFRTDREKYAAIIEAIIKGQNQGQPVLVGTTSIEKSELLSNLLKERGIAHQILNARYHEQEAHIVAQAGRPGAVTIATNMAGRGTDIQLGGNLEMMLADRLASDGGDPAVLRSQIEAEIATAKERALKAGGLWVIGTERHESRRIDNQLRGRSGRQGDPGRSTFFLSLQDDLMRIFGSERMDKMLQTLGLREGEAITHPWVNKAVAKAQSKVEARNFDFRKNLLKFDNVMNDQRKVIFEQRLDVLDSPDVADIVHDMRHDTIKEIVDRHVPPKVYADQWDVAGLAAEVERYVGSSLPIAEWCAEEGVDDQLLIERLTDAFDRHYAQRMVNFGTELMRQVEKQIVLQIIDHHWREHLVTLDHLRQVIGLRGYGQRDPLNEYKSEAFALFDALVNRLRSDATLHLMNIQVRPSPEPLRSPASEELEMTHIDATTGENDAQPPSEIAAVRASTANRNGLCPCGSGKKYKHCHGSLK